MDQVKQGTDALFILLGAIMVLAMHAGHEFGEVCLHLSQRQQSAHSHKYDQNEGLL